MKKLLSIVLLFTIIATSFAQDTLTQNSTGFKFEMYNNTMNIHFNEDTIASAELYLYKNMLTWGTMPYDVNIHSEKITDSTISLFNTPFETMVTSTGVASFSNEYGIYKLNEVFINFNDSLLSMKAFYTQQLIAPNGELTEVFKHYVKDLTPEQIDVFKELLFSSEVHSLYLNLYNEILGNS